MRKLSFFILGVSVGILLHIVPDWPPCLSHALHKSWDLLQNYTLIMAEGSPHVCTNMWVQAQEWIRRDFNHKVLFYVM